MGSLLYLDSSAIMKLVVSEPETAALRRLLHSWPERVSSVLSHVEVLRAARRIGADARRRAPGVLQGLTLIQLDEQVIERASSLEPAQLRSLDAIHVATALSLGDELGAMCAYDARLAEAASSLDIAVIAPA